MVDNARSLITKQIEAIRKYTQEHPELLKAHHFTYDLRLCQKPEDVEVVVMGLNPGEQPANWKLTNDRPSEETSAFNFFDGHGLSQAATKWKNNCVFFCGGKNVAMVEYFYWSSQTMLEFEKRWGKFELSPHLTFCAEMNRQLLELYSPKGVVSPGLNKRHIQRIAELYGLTFIEEAKYLNHRMVVRFKDNANRPWIFTKHWSGARGFSKAQKLLIRDYIKSELQ